MALSQDILSPLGSRGGFVSRTARTGRHNARCGPHNNVAALLLSHTQPCQVWQRSCDGDHRVYRRGHHTGEVAALNSNFGKLTEEHHDMAKEWLSATVVGREDGSCFHFHLHFRDAPSS